MWRSSNGLTTVKVASLNGVPTYIVQSAGPVQYVHSIAGLSAVVDLSDLHEVKGN